MELMKLCPACGERNPATEVICRVCMANLSSVAPVASSPTPAPVQSAAREPDAKTGLAGADSAGAGLAGDDSVGAGSAEAGLTGADATGAGSAGTGSDATMISRPEALMLSLPAGGAVSVQSGHVLGRRGDAGDVFEKFRTVSRRHARVTFMNGAWNIEDMESTNGTWVNGRRIEPKELCPLNGGDTVALSLSCEMKVLR